jgi:hypothetical protein
MQQQFNHAPNDSPRSGSSNRVTPMVWSAIVVAIIVVSAYLATRYS